MVPYEGDLLGRFEIKLRLSFPMTFNSVTVSLSSLDARGGLRKAPIEL